jgi:hypothetical protein
MEHFFPGDIITITTSMATEDLPASNNNKIHARPRNSNQTFGHPNLSVLKQNTSQSYVK